MQNATRFNMIYAIVAILGVLAVHDLWVGYRSVATLPYSEFLKLAAEAGDFAAYRRRAIIAHRARFGAECHPNICYYPELMVQDPLGEE